MKLHNFLFHVIWQSLGECCFCAEADGVASFPVLVPPSEALRGAFHSTKNSGLKFRVFHVTNGTVFSGWLGPTEKSGPPREVGRSFRNFSRWTEPFHSVLDRHFRKFWLNGKRPKLECRISRQFFCFLAKHQSANGKTY